MDAVPSAAVPERMKRAIVLVAFAAIGADAQMLQSVSVRPELVQLTAGSSATIKAYGKLGCCSKFPWHVVFKSDDNTVAIVDGEFKSPSVSANVTVRAWRPGTAHVVSTAIGNGTWPLATIEVFPAPIFVAESPRIATTVGQPVVLRIITDLSPSQTFSWYRGRSGDISHPLPGNGPECAFAADAAGTFFAWAMAVAPFGTNTAEFRIDVVQRRRSVRR
jgi:hypothetical protein